MPSSPLRRVLLALAVALAALPTGLHAFGFADVAARAEQLARSSYDAPNVSLPRELKELDYDQYRDIRFKPGNAIWRKEGLPFEIQLFHPGLYYDRPVKINLVAAGRTGAGAVQPLRFDPNLFDYGGNRLPAEDLSDLYYTGFRVHFPLNTKAYKDELLVMQGASYFRALGAGQRYGMSARGLAVDTAVPTGEEFPAFQEFWIQKPAANAKQLVIWALLDSKRVAGAYEFTVIPGTTTAIDVRARLFARQGVEKFGLAPLTSMFFHGSNYSRTAEDYRPEVHDSDGLLVANANGEWVWRPLVNPRRLIVTAFSTVNPRGFGLLQRRREFAAYEDLESRYDLRPSGWVEPKGDWGAGRVELVQIPSPDETNDNIVAYWVPNAPPVPGRGYDYAYRLSLQKDLPVRPPVASVLQTRYGHGWLKEDDGSLRMLVDFAAPPDGQGPVPIAAELWMDENAELLERQVFPNQVTGGWRLSFRFRLRDEDKPVEMRAVLKRGNVQVSETWSYVLPAE